jgi:phage tail protein X
MSLFEFARRDYCSVLATHPAVFELNPNLAPVATSLVVSAGAGLELPDPKVKSCHLAPNAAAALAV